MGGVGAEEGGGLAHAGEEGEDGVVGIDDVADDGDAVGFTKKDDVALGVSGHVVNGEAGDGVAFAEGAGDFGAAAGPDNFAGDFEEEVLADEGGVAFGAGDFLFMDGEAAVEHAGEAGGAALMIGVGVGEGDVVDDFAGELAAHGSEVPAGGGIDDDGFAAVGDVVGVEHIGGEEAEAPDAVGDLVHG